MLTNVTSLTGNGLKDWLIQRVSAVYFAIYMFFLVGFITTHSPLSYSQWHDLFHVVWFQMASLIALLMLSLHTWIGIWTVTTDYIKITSIRLFVQWVVLLLLLGQFFWGLMMVWGQ